MSRVLALTNWYPPHHLGGYEILCRDVMGTLSGRGHDVEVLCSDYRLPGTRPDPAGAPVSGIRVHRRLTMYWRDGEITKPSFGEQLRTERHNQAVIREVLDQFQPDVVAVWHMAAMSLNLLTEVARRKLPMVFCICDDWPIYGIELDRWSRHWQPGVVRRSAGRLAGRLSGLDAVLPDLGAAGTACVLSEYTANAIRHGASWRFRELSIVYPGVDRNFFTPEDGVPSDGWDWRLAYVGRFDVRKGIETIIQALPHLPEARLTVYGKGAGSLRSGLVDLAREAGVDDRVEMIDVGREGLPEAYRRADCVVFPSIWGEPFGLVPLEAMSCGIPVVATGVGGSAEYLRDGSNCLLFPPGDHHALAARVRQLAAEPATRSRLRSEGLITAARFDVSVTADGYETHLERAVTVSRERFGQ